MPHRPLLRLCSLTAALGLSTLTTPALAEGPSEMATASDAAGFNQFIVHYREGSAEGRDPAVVAAGLNAVAARTASRLDASRGGLRLSHLRRLALGADVIRVDRKLSRRESEALMREFSAHPDVDSVEVDGVVEPLFAPNDTYYGSQWQYSNNTTGIRAEAAWDRTSGAGVVVAVLDTGTTNHGDLNGNLLPGYDFISDSSRARDGNGRDGDPTDQGNWQGTNECGSDSPSRNSSWHGTHVMGSIAALTHNAQGVAGVAFNARIVPVRVLGRCGGNISDIADGIVWAAGGGVFAVPSNSNPASVINMSLGAQGACGSTIQNAINFAVGRGVAVVVAAGNDNVDASTAYPANCNNVITVAASTQWGSRADFSNYGGQIDVTAPGTSILSTGNTGTTTPGGEAYVYKEGTSMAAPHVAGIVALVKSARAPACPVKSPAQLEALLRSTARPMPGSCPGGCGAGLVDAAAAVAEAQRNTPPSAFFSYYISGFTVTVHGSAADCDGSIASYVMDFGDGTTTTSFDASHTYASSGSYLLTLTVRDNQGAVSGYVQSVIVTGTDSN